MAAVLAFGVVVRFVTASPLWLDEALSVHIADLPLSAIDDALRHDGHPPLYYWLLHGWMAWFGDGDVAVRALSGVFAVAALPLMWLAGRRVGGRPTAWLAVIALAVSPYAVRYATETRMYALVAFLVLVGHLLVRRSVDEQTTPFGRLAALAVVSGALVLTQYWAIFLAAGTVVVLAWWGRRAATPERGVAVRLLLAVCAGGLLFLPWLPAFLDQAAHTGTPWATAPRPTVVVDQTLRDFGGGHIAEGGILAAAIVVLALAGVFARRVDEGAVVTARPVPAVVGEASVTALTLALGAIAGLASQSTYASRYASVVLPLVVLLVARGLAVVPGRHGTAVATAVVVALGGVGIVENIRTDRTQAQEWVDVGEAAFGPDDVFVACPDQLGPALRRVLDQEGHDGNRVLAYPTLGDGRRVDWYDYAERNDAADPAAVAAAIAAEVPDGARVWVAWSGAYRTFEGDCEAMLNALAGGLGPFRTVVPDHGEDYFEHGALVVFDAAAP